MRFRVEEVGVLLSVLLFELKKLRPQPSLQSRCGVVELLTVELGGPAAVLSNSILNSSERSAD